MGDIDYSRLAVHAMFGVASGLVGAVIIDTIECNQDRRTSAAFYKLCVDKHGQDPSHCIFATQKIFQQNGKCIAPFWAELDKFEKVSNK